MRMQKPGRSASKSSRGPDAGARAASTVRDVSLTVGIGSESKETVTKDQRVPRGNTGVTTRPKLGETARVRSNHISAANDKDFLRVAGFKTSQDVSRRITKTRIRNQQVLGSISSAGSNSVKDLRVTDVNAGPGRGTLVRDPRQLHPAPPRNQPQPALKESTLQPARALP